MSKVEITTARNSLTCPKKRAMLFLCNCGTNIADFVDLDELARWAASHEDVSEVARHNLLCSPEGKSFFQETIRKRCAGGVVVAACSPKMHEKTFRKLCEETGVNVGHVHIANIREQCGWVTADKLEATAKAKDLIRGAIRRSHLAEDLTRRTMEVNTGILIIGGGIAGIEAALTASRAGRKVYIVERDISLGGAVIRDEEVAPTMECSPCMLAPLLSEIKDSPNIECIANAEVTSVVGFFGNFTAKIHKKARAVEDSCIGCEACFEVCPVEVRSRFHPGLGAHKAIHILFPGSAPAAAAIDKEACKHFVDGSCDACAEACPFGSINYSQEDQDMEIEVGAIIIATGYDTINPSGAPGLGYGSIDDVYTLPEFERIASSNGPYGGKIKLRNGADPMSIAVIHCTGEMLEADGDPYCPPLINAVALKVGNYARKHLSDTIIHHIYGDMVLAGPKEFALYQRQKKMGTKFLKCADMNSVKVSRNGRIRVEGRGFDPVEVDMVVLATGMKPASGARKLAEILNVELDERGYFKSAHDLLHQTGASIDGIYVVGCAAGPCDVAAAVTRGQAALGDALSKLVPGREIELEMMASVIDEERCAGCKLCVSVCPYKAVNYDSEKGICVISEAICRGCGTCAATCPSGASKARHSTDAQVYAEIEGVLNG